MCLTELPILLGLDGTRLHCTILYYTVLYYTILYYNALHYITMHYTILQCNSLQYTLLHCTTRFYNAVQWQLFLFVLSLPLTANSGHPGSYTILTLAVTSWLEPLAVTLHYTTPGIYTTLHPGSYTTVFASLVISNQCNDPMKLSVVHNMLIICFPPRSQFGKWFCLSIVVVMLGTLFTLYPLELATTGLYK